MFSLSNITNVILNALISLPAIIIAFSMHEYAHALAATKQGDSTPSNEGRLTLNPMAHVDWIGLLMLMVAGFGWAKPVHVNPFNFRDRRFGHLKVSLAGPLMNLCLAFVFSPIYVAAVMFIPNLNPYVADILWSFVSINCVLFAFNLIPVPPLDGFSLLRPVLYKINPKLVYFLERYGFMVLILLFISGAAGYLVSFVVSLLGNNFITMFYNLFVRFL